MEITTVHSIASAEAVLRNLEGRHTDTNLKIATNSRHHAAGGEIAIVQAILTWAQTQKVARLDTFVEKEAELQLTRLTAHIAGLCAALLCDEARGRDGQDVLAQLRGSALARLNSLLLDRPGVGSRGPQVELVCLDQRQRGLPRSLYSDGGVSGAPLKDERAFYEVARVALKKTAIEGVPLAEDRGLVNALGDCLYELFRNTHDHARLDIRGNHIARSVRGVHARRHAINPAALADIVKDSPPLADYCRRLQPDVDRRDLQLLEFSVFDAGPGLAARWRNKPVGEMEPDDELRAVSECFLKHRTVKGIDGRGNGLPIVIAALRERNGFVRIRSGRLALFADLGVEQDLEFGIAPNLQHWSAKRKLPPAAGTLFTFLMPLERAA